MLQNLVWGQHGFFQDDDSGTSPAEAAEVADLIEPLATSLGVTRAVLSLHHRDDDGPRLLSCWGAPGDDGSVEDVLAHACEFDGKGPAAGATSIERGWLGSFGQRGRSLVIPFGGRHDRSRIIFSAVYEPGSAVENKLILAVLQRLAPMLNAYLGLWQRHRRTVIQNRGLKGALNAMDLGVVLLDRGGDIVFTNAAADATLGDGRCLRRRGSTISSQQLGDTLKLQAAIAQAVATNVDNRDGRPGAEPALLRITAAGQDLIVGAFAADQLATDADAVAAMLVFVSPDAEPETLIAPVCRLYGLSVVETRLTSLILAGRSLGDASTTMRIKEQTARGYLKQIFSKTSVRRQSDLVRLLLSSVVRARFNRPSAAAIPLKWGER